MQTETDLISKVTKDMKAAAIRLTTGEARYLVDSYYQMQEFRKASDNQWRALGGAGEPNEAVGFVAGQFETVEGTIKKLLAAYSASLPVGQWAESICGIGPVISAGLLANVDITKCPTVGRQWAFAGLDPTRQWKKGQKRPWNARLKTLCWKIGESFVKQNANENDIYGKVWRARKDMEIERNEKGLYADQAKAVLTKFKIGKETEAYAAYSVGKLPPAHIHARAKRYAVKLFLAHWHHVAYELHFGTTPPKPYVLDRLGHTKFIAPPNWPMRKKR